MGLLDQITGALGGKNSGSIDYAAILQWVNQQGGISGLLEKFRQGGVAEIVQSWISTGANLPISGEQIQNILSQTALQQLSSKLGITNEATSGILAEFLPQIVDKLSPDGKEPTDNALVTAGLNMLKNKFFG